MNLSVDNR